MPLDGRKEVGEGNGGDLVLGVEGKRSLSSQRPDAEELGHRVEHHHLLGNHPHRQKSFAQINVRSSNIDKPCEELKNHIEDTV